MAVALVQSTQSIRGRRKFTQIYIVFQNFLKGEEVTNKTLNMSKVNSAVLVSSLKLNVKQFTLKYSGWVSLTISLVKGQVSFPGVILFFTIWRESKNCSKAAENLHRDQTTVLVKTQNRFVTLKTCEREHQTCSLWEKSFRHCRPQDTQRSAPRTFWSSPGLFVLQPVPAFGKAITHEGREALTSFPLTDLSYETRKMQCTWKNNLI